MVRRMPLSGVSGFLFRPFTVRMFKELFMLSIQFMLLHFKIMKCKKTNRAAGVEAAMSAMQGDAACANLKMKIRRRRTEKEHWGGPTQGGRMKKMRRRSLPFSIDSSLHFQP